MDVVGLQDPAEIRLVRRTRAKALERRFLVSKSFKEGKWEFCRIECPLRKRRNGFFNLNGVHTAQSSASRLKRLRCVG
jgi:hypothetical protein